MHLETICIQEGKNFVYPNYYMTIPLFAVQESTFLASLALFLWQCKPGSSFSKITDIENFSVLGLGKG